MILLNAIYFLPAFATLLWIVLFVFKQKTRTQRLMFTLLFFCLYYYISYALYISPWTDYLLMARFDVLNLPVSMAILALNIEFVIAHHTPKFSQNKWHWLIYLPAVAYLFMTVLLYYQVGIDRVAYCVEMNDKGQPLSAEFLTPGYRVHNLVTSVLFNAIAFVAILLTIYICHRVSWIHGYRWGDIYRFFFKSTETSTIRVLCVMDAVTISAMVPLAVLGRMWMLHHPIFSAIMSMLTAFFIFCLNYVEYYIELRRCTLYELSHLELSLSMNKQQPFNSTGLASSVDDDNDEVIAADIPEGLPRLVHQAFEEQRIYRDPDLSIASLSELLGTNRTTLSATINQCFGVPFRQLITNYRVEAAKAYMLEHPKATQDAIAMECGFSSAQAFNLKFKAATGLAPRAWLLSNHAE